MTLAPAVARLRMLLANCDLAVDGRRRRRGWTRAPRRGRSRPCPGPRRRRRAAAESCSTCTGVRVPARVAGPGQLAVGHAGGGAAPVVEGVGQDADLHPGAVERRRWPGPWWPCSWASPSVTTGSQPTAACGDRAGGRRSAGRVWPAMRASAPRAPSCTPATAADRHERVDRDGGLDDGPGPASTAPMVAPAARRAHAGWRRRCRSTAIMHDVALVGRQQAAGTGGGPGRRAADCSACERACIAEAVSRLSRGDSTLSRRALARRRCWPTTGRGRPAAGRRTGRERRAALRRSPANSTAGATLAPIRIHRLLMWPPPGCPTSRARGGDNVRSAP